MASTFVLLGIGGVLSTPTTVGAASAGTASTLDIVGGPIAVGSMAVVVSVDQKHILHLDGVDPDTDNLLWQHPYSASAITPGVSLTPAAAGSTVMDLVPAMKADNPVVVLAGVNATTGALEWRVPAAFVVSDNPEACVSNADFCVPSFNADGSSSLAVVSGATGTVTNVINGPNRAIGTGLYESDAHTPTFQQISPSGTLAWSQPVSSIFGPGYDPNFGWDITPVAGLNVGSVAPVVSGSTMDLSKHKTAGFSPATGIPQWTLPGDYQCMGPLAVLTTQVLCQLSGTLRKPTSLKQTPSFKGVTLKVVGFNPSTGAVTWSVPVSDVASLTTGNGVRFLDGTQLVVENTAGKSVDLDTSTGRETPLKPGQVAWCERIPTYRVVAIKGAPGKGERTGQPVFFPCSANGHPVASAPPSTPSTIGTTINGVFVWPSPRGLQTHPVAGAHLTT